MTESPLRALLRCGQSPWLDFIQRGLLRSGELGRMVEHWGIRGVTSNPTIFEKAIAHSSDYDDETAALRAAGADADDIYEALVVDDIQAAADVLAPIYERTELADGFVSLEVSPHLVRDTAGTVSEARRLWALVDRPNLMIKVPGTLEGLAAVSALIADGINVNVTLLFSVARYRDVADAYMRGLESALAAGRPLDSVASVASFFLSRIDSMVDPLLDAIAARGGTDAVTARALRGETAIASAVEAYRYFRLALRGPRFERLAQRGARPQRLLWASTGTKDPAYSDIKYIEPLIAPDTVNTMPLATLEAYDDHGRPAVRLTGDAEAGADVLARLDEVGIDLDAVTDRLLEEGIAKFIEPFDALHRRLGAARQ
jgi:transaldolase